LPQVASTAPAPTPAVAPPNPVAADVPQSSVGQRAGSAQGAGPITVNASDFPFAWYLKIVQSKITAGWNQWVQPGHQPVVVFTIERDGRVSGITIDKSSGNTWYDQKALRTINDAAPFPPLPPEWTKPGLTIKIGFAFQDRG
jgi:TonB family protein